MEGVACTDLLWLIDASLSISEGEWDLQKQFVFTYMLHLSVGLQQHQTRASIIFFSSHTKAFDFNDVTRRENGVRGKAVREVFESYVQEEDLTYTGLAVERAKEMFEDVDKGSRIEDASVAKVMIVLTDGYIGDISRFYKNRHLLAKAHPEVEIFAIGTDKEANLRQLYQISGSKSRAWKYSSFEQFSKDVVGMLLKMCKNSTNDESQNIGASYENDDQNPFPLKACELPKENKIQNGKDGEKENGKDGEKENGKKGKKGERRPKQKNKMKEDDGRLVG